MPTIYRDIPYGNDFLQKVDILVPTYKAMKGVIVWFHGGGWNGGAKSASGFTPADDAYTNNDDAIMQEVADAGYAVVNCNYRLTSDATYGYGGSSNGFYPNNVIDVETVLTYVMVYGTGEQWHVVWNRVYAAASQYGVIVAGASAGGHLAMEAVGRFVTDNTRLWPVSVCSMAGPMDLAYNLTDNIVDPLLISAIFDPYTNNSEADRIAASPRHSYGTSGSPGEWYDRLNAASCKFYFIQNTNDTLVVPTMVSNFVNELPAERTTYTLVTEGTVTPGVFDHNFVATTVPSWLLGIAAEAFDPFVETGKIIRHYDYNFLQREVDEILGLSQDGYGVSSINSVSVTNSNQVSTSQWNSLLLDFDFIHTHVYGAASGLPSVLNTTTEIAAAFQQAYHNTIVPIYDTDSLRYSCTATQYYHEGIENINSRGGVSTSTSSIWYGSMSHIYRAEWATDLVARYFFNTGATFAWNTFYTPAATTSSSDTSWADFMIYLKSTTPEVDGPIYEYKRADWITTATTTVTTYTSGTMSISIMAVKNTVTNALIGQLPSSIKFTVTYADSSVPVFTVLPAGYNLDPAN